MIATITLIIQLIPLILDLVKAIEAAIPIAGKGQAKREFALDIVKAGVGDALPEGRIGSIVDGAVGLMNATGWGKG